MPKQDATVATERNEAPIVAVEGTLALLVLLLAGSGCAAVDLRDRLVPASANRHRGIRCLAGTVARRVHGRDVFEQRIFCARHRGTPPSAARLRPTGVGHRSVLGFSSSSAFPWVGRHCCRSFWRGDDPGSPCAESVAGRLPLLPPTMLMGSFLYRQFHVGRREARIPHRAPGLPL